MLHPPDIRYKAAGHEVAGARAVVFPVGVEVKHASGARALAVARGVVEQLRKAAGGTEIPGARLTVPEFEDAGERLASELSIEQTSKREVKVQLVFSAVLTFEAPGDF